MAEETASTDAGRPLIFGEVLFDNFPDGSSVLGGAPFNVAWHLQGFGLNPLLISRIGNDPAGLEVIGRMAEWGLDTRGIQRDPSRPTGSVTISLHDGQPVFDICNEQAYDYIDIHPVADIIKHGTFSLLYHGSLAARNATSRKTLHWLTNEVDLPTFVDINIRPPWWTREEVYWALRRARWLKLNADEISALTEDRHGNNVRALGQSFLREFELELLILTMGDQGAALISSIGELKGDPVLAAELVDTVGAGDAFSAVVILGLLRDWGYKKILQNAIEFASAICGVRGATVSDPDFYLKFLRRWEN